MPTISAFYGVLIQMFWQDQTTEDSYTFVQPSSPS